MSSDASASSGFSKSVKNVLERIKSNINEDNKAPEMLTGGMVNQSWEIKLHFDRQMPTTEQRTEADIVKQLRNEK
ncbi:hypothetical protein QR680_010027 [Steinernema hermaphroditum]|uniref:Uncharacterized protein n=1 Tax=Steinernema hermaphroditum TaxID=289476 RepID=A0AA39IMG0_9BILA|nr:hypothetical protein QR680_010027 [Steinernema hermaphroditum]